MIICVETSQKCTQKATRTNQFREFEDYKILLKRSFTFTHVNE